MATFNESIGGETRENISLKTGAKKKSWLNFSFKENCLEGSNLVIISFAALTIVITISLVVQIYYGDYQIIPHGSVATDSKECSLIGLDILKQGGSAVDAAIASTFCLAVVNPHKTGLDAGGVMMIYSHRNRLSPEIIDFTYENTKTLHNLPFTRLIIGMIYAHLKYGKLSWRYLVKPAANLASQGFIVSTPLAQAAAKEKNDKFLENIIAGKTIKFSSLGVTLYQFADIGEDVLETEFFSKMKSKRTMAIKSTFQNHNIYVPNNPSLGPKLLQNLQDIGNMSFAINDQLKPEFVIHLAQLLQNLYKSNKIGNNYQEGTSSNVAVMDTNDLYVSSVTGMSASFGTKELTPFGYFLDTNSTLQNNTYLPIIITDKNFVCGRRIAMGTGDLSIASQVITNLLLLNENVTSSIESPRFHFINQTLIGIETSKKPTFDDTIYMSLRTFGTVFALTEPYNSCNIIEKVKDDLSSHSDSRGGGLAYRF